MSTTTPLQTATSAGQAVARVLSIDIFRGLTMMVMIFVNDLASVHGLPWWTYHMQAEIDAMTYVDMVFPFFLFTVGMSIPLAVTQRLKRDTSYVSLSFHVIVRAFALLILGLILANAEKVDGSLTGLNPDLWALIALLGAVLLWGVFGDPLRHPRLSRAIRVTGFVLLVVMFAIFRRTTHTGHVGWIDPSYPEILGLIAYTYVAVSILYIPTRRWIWAPLAWCIALVGFNALSTARWIGFPDHVPLYLWPFGNGAMASITMAGVVTSNIFLGTHRWNSARQRMLLALAFAIAALAAGFLLTPLGISKIRATPTWCLYSVGASVLLFTALYWICDVKKAVSWAFFVRPAGSNTLLTYLLPDFYYFLIGLLGIYYPEYWNAGWPGVLRASVFTLLILGLSGLLTRWKLRMRL